MASHLQSTPKLYFVKLGGSLITDKSTPRTPREDVIARLAEEIYLARDQLKDVRLLLGHGSGSYGHVPAKKYGTRQGVKSMTDWKGFAEVWYEASTLNHLVIKALHRVGLPAASFPISASALAQGGQIISWALQPLKKALEIDLLPVVYGDVVFDTLQGGTILSTEDIFTYLARIFKPQRILLAGIDEAVFADFPQRKKPIPEITSGNWDKVAQSLHGANMVDVTGGMKSKVQSMLALTAEISGVSVQIFSGDQPGNLLAVLRGGLIGTRISN